MIICIGQLRRLAMATRISPPWLPDNDANEPWRIQLALRDSIGRESGERNDDRTCSHSGYGADIGLRGFGDSMEDAFEAIGAVLTVAVTNPGSVPARVHRSRGLRGTE